MERRPATGEAITLSLRSMEHHAGATIDVRHRVRRYEVGMLADGVFDSVAEFADHIGSNNIAIGEMQECWLWGVVDAKGKRESNLVFYGPTCHSGKLNTPLLNRIHCGVH